MSGVCVCVQDLQQQSASSKVAFADKLKDLLSLHQATPDVDTAGSNTLQVGLPSLQIMPSLADSMHDLLKNQPPLAALICHVKHVQQSWEYRLKHQAGRHLCCIFPASAADVAAVWLQ